MPRSGDDRPGILPLDLRNEPTPTPRGSLQFGLETSPLAVWTYEVTGGTAGAGNTHDITSGGVSILGGPIVQGASDSATADAFSAAVNALRLTTGLVATVSTTTVTITAVEAGALTLVKVVEGDATGTLTEVVAGTAAWTSTPSGATIDDKYYQARFNASLIPTPGDYNRAELDKGIMTELAMNPVGEGLLHWLGGLSANAAEDGIVPGIATADGDWSRPVKNWDGAFALVIKAAGSLALNYEAEMI